MELGEDYFVHVRADAAPVGSNFTIWYTEPTEEPTMSPSGGATTLTHVSIVASILVATIAMLGFTSLGA